MNRESLLFWGGLLTGAAVLAVTAVLAAGALRQPLQDGDCRVPSAVERPAVATVGGRSLLAEQASLARLDSAGVSAWVRDELLAQYAESLGVTDPEGVRLAQQRARQLLLRDRLLQQALEDVPVPGRREVLALAAADSLTYGVERHFYQILVGDSATAESILTRLQWGESFQITAQRLSEGQRAGIGGDMGFLTGGELVARGYPDTLARLEGLSPVFGSPRGWHLFLATETRPLEDTARLARSLSGPLYERRLAEKVDSLVELAAMLIETDLDSTWRYD